MKRRLILIFSAMLMFTSLSKTQTTMEEYNYVTKGYRVQVESGLDPKAGYRFVDITQQNTKSPFLGVVRNTTFKALYRIGESKPCAILCILSKSSAVGKEYICIPQFASSPEVWELANTRLDSFRGDDARMLVLGIAALASYYSSN